MWVAGPFPCDGKPAVLKIGQIENDLENRGLTRAVFSNQSVNLSLPDGQIDILENLMRTVALLSFLFTQN